MYLVRLFGLPLTAKSMMIIGREDENETAKLLPHELCLGPVGFVPNGSRSFIVDILCL